MNKTYLAALVTLLFSLACGSSANSVVDATPVEDVQFANDATADTVPGDLDPGDQSLSDAADTLTTDPGDLTFVDGVPVQCLPENTSGDTSIPTLPGDYLRFVDHQGSLRRYLVKIPTGYDNQKSVPLVLFFHGGGGSATGSANSQKDDFVRLAETEGFILVFPDGHTNAWNAVHCCSKALACNVDDVGFVKTLVETLQGSLKIDAKRIYATGFSNGGMFTHRLAAELPGIFAAVAPAAGTVGGKSNTTADLTQITPTASIPIMLVHGKEDKRVTFGGGLSVEGDPNRTDISFADSVSLWVNFNNCETTPVVQQVTTTKGQATFRRFTGCDNAVTVVGLAIDGLGHAWPKAGATGGFDGTQAIFDFFKSHPKP